MGNAYVTGTAYPLTGITNIDVTTNGYRWYFPRGETQTISWSISSSKWNYTDFQSTETQADFALVFEGISELINVDFKFLGYVKSNANQYGYVIAGNSGSNINISAAFNGKNSNGLEVNDGVFSSARNLGRAYFPNTSFNEIYPGAAGDVWLNYNSQDIASSTFEMGTPGYFVLLHEILHSLGLKHPHDDGGTGRPTYKSIDATFLDRQWVSAMSYDTHETGGDGTLLGSLPIGPMLLDAIALQYLYGESKFNAGDTKYDLARYLGDYYNCQWDASGIDTLDGSNLTYGISVELGTGSTSNGTNTHNYGFVTTALDQIYLEVLGYNPTKWTWLWGEYENVNGTPYADNIVGNDLENVINGGSGDDYLYGGAGNDTLDWDVSQRGGNDYLEGGDGDDTYVLDSYYDEIVELSNEGVDTVYVGYSYSLVNTYLENIRTFSNQTAGLTFTGNAWGNEIDGGQGADTLIGNAGNDTLSGNAGNDFITGGSGNDLIDGGDGSDTAIYANNFNNYSIKFNSLTKKYSITANAGTDGADTFINTEFLRFSDRTVSVDSLNLVVASYTITSQQPNVDEGEIATFNVATTKVNTGTILRYSISGVSSADISGGLLSGNVTIGSDGTARILVGLLADYLTEGPETLTVTLEGQSASTLIKDKFVSKGPAASDLVYVFKSEKVGFGINPASYSYFYTTNTQEAVSIKAQSNWPWVEKTATFEAAHSIPSLSVPVFRFWSEKFQAHFFTINKDEKDQIISWSKTGQNGYDWKFEGENFKVYTSSMPTDTLGKSAIPVYRIWMDDKDFNSSNGLSGGHYFTANKTEYDSMIKLTGVVGEGVAFYGEVPGN
jgi:Ca2+-binding RTX toxin-like protein